MATAYSPPWKAQTVDPNAPTIEHSGVKSVDITTICLGLIWLGSATLALSPAALAADGVRTRPAPVGSVAGDRHAGAQAEDSSRKQRALIVEGNLKDLSRSLEQQAPPEPAPQGPVTYPPRAKVPVEPESRAGELALRGNLHRLRREVVIEQTPDPRKVRVDESIERAATPDAPADRPDQ